MHRLLSIILILPALPVAAQEEMAILNGHQFLFKTALLENENGDSIRQLTLSRDGAPLLTHILYKPEGDCNSEAIEIGGYEVSGDSIFFYSYWARAGDAPVSPFGVRKQVYVVAPNGQLSPVASALYIETSREGWPENKGIRYLFTPPKTKQEQTMLAEYIRDAEQYYHAQFVQGAKQRLLFKEVRAKLQKPIREATKNWKEFYRDKLGGYKM